MAYRGFRSVQLRRGAATLNLTSAPYQVVAGSWANAGQALECKLLIQGTSLAEIERHLDDVNRWLALAQECMEGRLYDQVQVRTKVCDAVSAIAELGATWRVKTVTGGTLMPNDPSLSAAGRYTVQATLSLTVAEHWRRASAAPLLEAVSDAGLTVRSDGGITSNGVALTARRVSWTANSGVTVRYRWLAAAANCEFFKVSDIKAWWDNANRRFKMQDNAGTPAVAQSGQYIFTVGQEVDVVFRWSHGVGMAIWVNGTADGSAATCTMAEAPTATIFEPTGSQTILSVQLWPTALSDAQCAGLAEWQRPEAELPVVINPPNSLNTNARYLFLNAPGTAPGGLMAVATTGAVNQDQIRLGLRALATPPALKFECEDGALITGVTKVADANASGDNVARVTPADTSWRDRVSVQIVSLPSGLGAYAGDYRLFALLKDNAASAGVNQVQFQVTVGGASTRLSDPMSAQAVGVRSLIDLGVFSLPAGLLPVESLAPGTAFTAPPYVSIMLRSRNMLGSGGGTLDLDAIYLAPAEAEGAAMCPNMSTPTHIAVLDWTGDAPTGILALDARSLEFADWVDWVGHDLTLQPNAGAAGVLWGYALRDGVEQAWPKDVLTLWFRFSPRWR